MVVATVIVVIALAGSVVAHWLQAAAGVLWLDESPIGQILMWTGFLWVAVIGAVIVARQPRNPMGWILASVGVMIGVFPAGDAYVDLVIARGDQLSPSTAMLVWPNLWYWWALLGAMFVFIPLLFPNGKLLSRRWRPVAWLGGVSVGALCVLGALAETITTQEGRHDVANPIGITGLAPVEEHAVGSALFAGMLVAMAGAVVALVVRFRRSRGAERQQLKWFALAVAMIPVVLVANEVGERVGTPQLVDDVLFGLLLNGLPLAIGLAILRYRLYDIDRIVSRTVGYVLLTAVLIGVYAGGVVGLGAAVRAVTGAESSDLVVAASTLAVAALFGPARRRIQAVVDRRFNRTRYDARRIVEAFALRLRDELDLGQLGADLEGTALVALQPAVTTVWLVPHPSAPPSGRPRNDAGTVATYNGA